MPLKPWYKVVTPREDLREGRPLDASEFAVHLDHVRDRRAPADYQQPERFFERTFLTKNLLALAASAVRRMGRIKVETSAVFNLTTQFGGGKTHALTLLYHLARSRNAAKKWKGVQGILDAAGASAVPDAAVAVFVGTEFDSLTGRGGSDGIPRRHTPWGEIAFQLGGEDAFRMVAKHDQDRTAPSSEVIRSFLPQDRAVLILMDELLNYMGRNRKSGLTGQLYSFLHNLSEEARAQDRVVLVVSLPSLMDEMTPEDEADFDRFQKLLNRLGKTMILSAETETSEIIRRRLFEWGGLPNEARAAATEYAGWIVNHRAQIPSWFPVDHALDQFLAAYPFHPCLLSVFERKWQQLPRFQQTRGILRLLALWVSNAYQDGFKGGHKDPVIGTGTAPLDDPLFRSAIFEQLGGAKHEGAVTTDICGRKDSHAVRLDKEAVETIRKARLHQKVATTIFFESNGGQLKTDATLPEIRLAVAEPDLDIGNIETVLDALSGTCYFLTAERNRYRFSLAPNLNKLLADRKASVQPAKIEERVRTEVQKVFADGKGVERVLFPTNSGQIPDRAAITLVVLPPEQSMMCRESMALIDTACREHGSSARTFKSALIWVVPDEPAPLREAAREVLAWEEIQDEQDIRLDESQKRLLLENMKKAQRDVREAVWRTYNKVVLLGKENDLKIIDLGLVHSSAAESLVGLVLNRLRGEGDIEEGASPNFLVRNWPPAFTEWSTRSVRDAFFASPQFPKLLNPEAIKQTIARGVENGMLAYVGKSTEGCYSPFHWKSSLAPHDVELSEEMFVITGQAAEAYKKGEVAPPPPGPSAQPASSGVLPGTMPNGGHQLPLSAEPSEPSHAFSKLIWQGSVPPQKWMNFYTKVLSKYAVGGGLTLTLRVEIAPPDGVSAQKVEETKTALRDLGMEDKIETKQ